MQKVTMIIGEPAVGKSTIMRRFLREPSESHWKFQSMPWTPHHLRLDKGVMVLGRYDEAHEFPGTDRLSMAVQPKAIEFVLRNSGYHILFEGDRLGNDKMIKALQHIGVDLEVICIVTNVDRRRASQSNAFRTSRRTKIKNMTGVNGRAARSGQPIKRFVHDTPEDTAKIVDYLIRERV